MPKTTISSYDEYVNVLCSALSNADIDYMTDWKDCGGFAEYVIIPTGLESEGYKKYVYFKQSGSSFEIHACDNIWFWNEYDEKTGEFVCRHVEISGDYHINSGTIYIGDYTYNSNTNRVAALCDINGNCRVLVGFFYTVNGDYSFVVGSNSYYMPYWYKAGIALYGEWIDTDEVKKTSNILFVGGSSVIAEIEELKYSKHGYGDVFKVDGVNYVKVGSNFGVKGDGTEGDFKGEYSTCEFDLAELVNDKYVLCESVEIDEAELTVYPYVDGEPLDSIIVVSSTYLDENVAERIEEHPEDFPETGQAVLDKSKRIITRLEFG